MTLLNQVRSGMSRRPLRVCVYGTEGVGKTSFAADAPAPIFITNEDGATLIDIQALIVDKWPQVRDAVRELAVEPHAYKTIVFDTVDHLERLLISWILQEEEVNSIDKVGGGFGKGWTMVRQEWSAVIADLDICRHKRGMHVIFLAHAENALVQNPNGADYNQWDLRCNKKTAAMFKEWPEMVLFADWDIQIKASSQEKGKGVLGKGKNVLGERKLYTERNGGYVAKHRFGHTFPKSLDLDWDTLIAAVEVAYKDAGVDVAYLRQSLAFHGIAWESWVQWRQERQQPAPGAIPAAQIDGVIRLHAPGGKAREAYDAWLASKGIAAPTQAQPAANAPAPTTETPAPSTGNETLDQLFRKSLSEGGISLDGDDGLDAYRASRGEPSALSLSNPLRLELLRAMKADDNGCCTAYCGWRDVKRESVGASK